MANPEIYSKNSVQHWGRKIEDYIKIHKLFDPPKSCMNNNTIKALTHQT